MSVLLISSSNTSIQLRNMILIQKERLITKWIKQYLLFKLKEEILFNTCCYFVSITRFYGFWKLWYVLCSNGVHPFLALWTDIRAPNLWTAFQAFFSFLCFLPLNWSHKYSVALIGLVTPIFWSCGSESKMLLSSCCVYSSFFVE